MEIIHRHQIKKAIFKFDKKGAFRCEECNHEGFRIFLLDVVNSNLIVAQCTDCKLNHILGIEPHEKL